MAFPAGVWFVQIANNFGANHEYTPEQKADFHDPYKITEHAKSIEDQVNGLWGSFYKNAKAQSEGQAALRARMAEMIKDERLLKGFTPTFGIGCRRITPGDPYMESVTRPSCSLSLLLTTFSLGLFKNPMWMSTLLPLSRSMRPE